MGNSGVHTPECDAGVAHSRPAARIACSYFETASGGGINELPVMRTRHAALRTLPSNTYRTPSSRPTCFTSMARPLYAKLELRTMTNNALKRDSAVMISLCHSVGKIFLLRIGADVAERQHGDRGTIWMSERVFRSLRKS